MNKNTTEFKHIYFIAMLYMTLMILCSLIGSKLIKTPYSVMSGASLVCPFIFLMGDIVAEVYGYKIVMRLFFSGLICKIILILLSYFIINLPSPPNWDHQKSYVFIIGNLPRIYGFSILGMMTSWSLNAFILTRWKYIVKGKYFWIRSILTSGMSEILFTLISVTLTLIGTVPQYDIFGIVIWSILLKILFTIIFSYPVTCTVNWLKRSESVDIYDNKFGLNPFKEIIHEN